ncbi:MAG: hypothetical protein ABI467_14235 [Kofleriaceae bacterium]
MQIHKAIASKQQSRAVVLYGDDGRVIHTHVMYAVNGGTIATPEQAERRAFEIAKDLGRDVATAKVLHVDDPSVLTSGRFVVDPDTRALRPIPRPIPVMPKPG